MVSRREHRSDTTGCDWFDRTLRLYYSMVDDRRRQGEEISDDEIEDHEFDLLEIHRRTHGIDCAATLDDNQEPSDVSRFGAGAKDNPGEKERDAHYDPQAEDRMVRSEHESDAHEDR